MENFETIQAPRTAVELTQRHNKSCKFVRHATKVIDRILRSPNEYDQALKERISKAVSVLSQTRSTETAILHTHKCDSLSRLASRVVRKMEING